MPLAGSRHRWGDYEVGEKIDHIDAMTIEEAEHQLATRLYQNTAKVHFNQHEQAQGRFGRRLIYGGHIISLARALSFNGLENAFHIAAINAGRHVSPAFAGDTVYAYQRSARQGADRPAGRGRAQAAPRGAEGQARRRTSPSRPAINTTQPCCSTSTSGCSCRCKARLGTAKIASEGSPPLEFLKVHCRTCAFPEP